MEKLEEPREFYKADTMLRYNPLWAFILGERSVGKSFEFKTNYWSAIPGGIPSKLINGICVKNNNYSESELDTISSLFPDAVLFDSSRKVLRCPLSMSPNVR